ncbi:MAG: hypothetical protein ABIJ50_08420 [Pseudomonadota bacterium]
MAFVMAVLLTAAFLTAGPMLAGAADQAKEVETIVRNAERQMHNGKNQDADALLQQALVLMEQARVASPDDKSLLRVEKKYNQIRQQLDKKLGQASQRNTAPQTPQATPQADGDKMPGGVSKRLKDIGSRLDDAERYLVRNALSSKSMLDQASEIFAEIDKMYAGKFDPHAPEYAAVLNRYTDLQSKIEAQSAAETQATANAAAGKAAGEQQSAEWVAKFQHYLSYPGQEGHNPDMLVFVPGTSEPEKFDEAKKHFEAFKAFYAEYQKIEFPNGRTWQLEDLANNQAPLRIQDFETTFADRINSVAGGAEQQIAQAMAQLEKDNGWRTDKKIQPHIVDHKWMTSIRESAMQTMTALGANDPKAKAVQAQLDALVAKDQENRSIRKDRTFMTPDRYTGSDIKELKEKATALVKNDSREGGKPLRCTIVSPNWREETVEEWADTSRTVWRKRTTRHITAQVAATTTDGVRLITVDLATDRQADGTWGPLYGNLHQGSDPMLEANVSKDGP